MFWLLSVRLAAGHPHTHTHTDTFAFSPPQVKVNFRADAIAVSVHGQDILSGRLAGRVVADDCLYTIGARDGNAPGLLSSPTPAKGSLPGPWPLAPGRCVPRQ